MNELSQIFINLIQNSRDAFIYNKIKKRIINISTKNIDSIITITFQDNAGGIKIKDINKIFEPYFTTKHSSSGTGLGLFMSRMICEQGFNGTIIAKNYQNGAIFIIKIPLDN
jgi:signal transduction histidine kinase